MNYPVPAKRIAILMAALSAAVFIFSSRTRAADGDFPFYFENSKLIVKSENINRTGYVPLVEIVRALGLPYTDATGLETFTIRSGTSRLVLTKNSALISINDQIVLLGNPVRRDEKWMVPLDFLQQGLGRITGMTFRNRPGSPRVFAGNVEAPELVMNAQVLGSITRLTVRLTASVQMGLRRDDPRHAVLTIDRSPVDPLREQVDQRDRIVRSIAFDDSDGSAKILVDLSEEAGDIRITPADNNRLFFVDFMRLGDTTATPPPTTSTATKPDQAQNPGQARRNVRVVVIDPGHGGMDTGTRNETVTEKELTLALARKLRTALESRLGATVLLTRDSDIDLDNEARSAVANNNQANLFISLHIGFSPNKMESGSSVFVMKDDFGDLNSTAGLTRGQLFLPWYLGYRTNHGNSLRAANILQEELSKAISGWKFPVRSAPLGVLTSATMPALMLELGNLNNTVTAQTLTDPGFQSRLVTIVANAVQRFSATEPSPSN